jgi:hypothetical protein
MNVEPSADDQTDRTEKGSVIETHSSDAPSVLGSFLRVVAPEVARFLVAGLSNTQSSFAALHRRQATDRDRCRVQLCPNWSKKRQKGTNEAGKMERRECKMIDELLPWA